MFFAISQFIAGLFGLDISKVQRWVIVAAAVLIFVIVLVAGLVLKSCFSKTAKIDIKSVEKINNGNRKEREAELREVIEQNADVVSTVDNRAAITEVNTIERNREIDAKVKEADKKIIEAKDRGEDVTNESLECILVPDHCK